MFKKTLLIIVLSSSTLLSQTRGTPSQLRIKIDSLGALAVSSAAITNPITTVQFLNARLRVDSNGYLVITDGSGSGFAPADATYITRSANSTLSNEFSLGTLTTGILLNTVSGSAGTLTSLGSILPVTNGGTGFASYTIGDLLYASASGVLSKLSDVGTGQVLVSGGVGVAPAYSANPTVTSLTASGNINSTGAATVLAPNFTLGGINAGWYINASNDYTFAYANLAVLSFGSQNGNGLRASNNVKIGWSNSTYLTNAGSDGLLNIVNNSNSSGIGFDISTDSTIKIRNRAQNAYGNIDALAFLASGTPITSGTTFLTSGSGMAVTNVGANSCGTSAASITGNNNLFTFTVGATAGTQCRVTFTLTATNTWGMVCADDTTTVAVRTTAVDTTHADAIGTFTAGDQVTCIALPR